MRKLLMGLVITATVMACSTEKKAIPTAKLSGHIDNIGSKDLFLVNRSSIDTLQIDSLGNFSYEKELGEASFPMIVLGRKSISLFLYDGIDLKLNTSANKFSEEVNFEGSGSSENTLLSDLAKLRTELAYSPAIFKLGPKDFLLKSDSVKQVFNNLADTYSKNENVNTAFYNVIKTDIKYEQLYNYSIYTPYHKYFTKEDEELGNIAEKTKEEATVYSDDFVSSKYYIKFISGVEKDLYSSENDDQQLEVNNTDYIVWLNQKLNSPKLKNELFYNIVKNEITYSSEEVRDQMYKTYSKYNTDTEYQSSIDKIYKSFEKLRSGKKAAQWSYPDIDGNMHALSDYKGKIVYIDVWATWCGPCKAEIPALADLHNKYKEKDIVFVSVSVDDNSGAWKKMITEHKDYDWVQLHAEKAWKSEIVLNNEIKGIPRFMMIDKEGNIIDINAPRPSSEDITTYIDELLAK